MNLKEVNEGWSKSSANTVLKNIEKIKQRIELLKKEIVTTKRELEDANIELARAKEDKDKAKVEDTQKKIKSLIEKGQKLSAELKKAQEAIDKSKGKVDSYIEQLRQNPELKAHIDECLGKKFKRQLAKSKADKEQAEVLRNLIEKHPTFENNIIGMINARDEIIKLEEERKTLVDPKDTQRIDEIENTLLPRLREKMNMNKSSIMNYISKNKISLTGEYIDEFVKEGSKGFRHFKDGRINIKKTLNNKIKSCDKSIAKYERGLLELGIPLKSDEKAEAPGTTDNGTSTGKKFGEELSKEEGESKGESGLPATTEKPKWYQFIKRFKNWNEKRKSDKEKEPDETKPSDETKPTGGTKTSKEDFRDALKYDVVKEYMKQREEELTRPKDEQAKVAANVQEMMKDNSSR